MQLHRTMITTNEEMIKMNQTIKDMKAINMSVGSTTVVEDMEVEVNSLGITTTDHVGPSSVSHATTKVTDMQAACTKTGPT